MKHPHLSLERPIALLLALSMACPLCAQVAPAQQVPQQSSTSAAGESANGSQSNSLGTQTSGGAQALGVQQPAARPDQIPVSSGVSQSNPPPASGTAVAPYQKQVGITGSKPAGAAIAAGKQRRTRSFAIRAGLLVGAAIAIGIVVGASLGSPARAN